MDFCSVYLAFNISNDGCLLPELDIKSSTEWSYTIFAHPINMNYFFLLFHLKARDAICLGHVILHSC